MAHVFGRRAEHGKSTGSRARKSELQAFPSRRNGAKTCQQTQRETNDTWPMDGGVQNHTNSRSTSNSPPPFPTHEHPPPAAAHLIAVQRPSPTVWLLTPTRHNVHHPLRLVGRAEAGPLALEAVARLPLAVGSGAPPTSHVDHGSRLVKGAELRLLSLFSFRFVGQESERASAPRRAAPHGKRESSTSTTQKRVDMIS